MYQYFLSNPLQTIISLYLFIINLIGFLSMGIDKRKAIQHQWRIPENTLLLIAALFGSLGSYLGMKFFHHKTLHKRFSVGIPVFFIVQIILLLYFCIRFA